jgi:hypothetical protein
VNFINLFDEIDRQRPLGVAAYKTKELIENLKSSLPSIDDLEKTLNE